MINVVYHCSNSYIRFVLLSIYSIAKNTNKHCTFHILHNFNEKHTNIVQQFSLDNNIDCNLIQVNKELLDKLKVPDSYYKLLKPKAVLNLYEFQKAQNIIEYKEADFTCPVVFYSLLHKYLFQFPVYVLMDCDTIVTTDINLLFHLPYERNLCYMRKDWSNKTFMRDGIEYDHYNTSVVIAKKEFVEKYPELAFEHLIKNSAKSKFGMQHDFCIIAKNSKAVKELDYYWNFSVTKDKLRKNEPMPYLLHFNAIVSKEESISKHPLYEQLISVSKECNINFYINGLSLE